LSTLFILCTVGGFTGSMIDSILGATVQVKYYCEEQKLITEKRISKSHTNRIISGFPGISNDVVNFTSSFLSALLVMTVQKFL
ncbi:MAG: DUF92 domain-containing protein, partial [Fibrobacter sp.]|nr:DUF92 domain-containing protein [Fibrobacter sp.]